MKNKIRRLKKIVAVLMVAAGTLVTQESTAQEKPNIVIVFSDDQGFRDLGCYGSEFPTPHLDRLAAEGMKFLNFYSASAICTPSRFGLLTGKNPSRSKDRLLSALMFHDDVHQTLGLRPFEKTLPSVLKENGYETALMGKWHLGHGLPAFSPLQHGFDYAYGHKAGCVDYFTLDYGVTPDWFRNDVPLDETGYATDLITRETISYLKKRDVEKPFFLFLAYNAPHFGKGWDDGNDKEINILQPHPSHLSRVGNIKDPSRAKYAAMVTSLDDGVGQILDYLDSTGLADNTIVIFMSDHGGDPNYGGDNFPYRSGKATLFEGGVRIPCIVRWPGKIKPNTISRTVAWSLDWFPTLTGIINIKTDDLLLDGFSIEPVLKGTESYSERGMYWELGDHAELERGHWMAYRKGNWKYLNSPNDGEWLFNLDVDPYEQNNLKDTEESKFNALRTTCLGLSVELKKYSQSISTK